MKKPASRRFRPIAWGLWLLWLYLAYSVVAGWVLGHPEKSLSGTWTSEGRRIECRPDGSVSCGSDTSTLLTWQGSRLLFDERATAAALEGYQPDQKQWDLVLARQCGVIRMSNDLSEAPHVNHKQVGQNIEATVRWDGRNRFALGEVLFTRIE